MKLQKLLLIISFIAFSTGNIFAQNNDMKARIEFEDAETAYQNQDYSKAITHLESAEKLLGKATAKTGYLKVLSLDKLISEETYEYENLEKLRILSKKYVDSYSKVDADKFKEVYSINKKLSDYPKSKEELEILINQKKAAVESKKDAFLDYKVLSYYEDGKDPSAFKKYFFMGVFSFKDPETKKKRYGLQSAEHGIGFSANKTSYSHNIIDSGDITTSQKEKLTSNFLQEMDDFAKKYDLTPKISKTNADGWESFNYKFFYKNKTVQFSFGTGSYKGQLQYIKSTYVTNHNYENK